MESTVIIGYWVKRKIKIHTDKGLKKMIFIKSMILLKKQRWNFVSYNWLDPLNGKCRCRFVHGDPDKLMHTPIEKSNYILCALQRWKYRRKNKTSKLKCRFKICSDCLVCFCMSFFDLFYNQNIKTVNKLWRKVGK